MKWFNGDIWYACTGCMFVSSFSCTLSLSFFTSAGKCIQGKNEYLYTFENTAFWIIYPFSQQLVFGMSIYRAFFKRRFAHFKNKTVIQKYVMYFYFTLNNVILNVSEILWLNTNILVIDPVLRFPF